MERAEFEMVLQVVLEAVNEQYILPIALVLGTVTAAICVDEDVRAAVASALTKQAESVPEGVAGRALVESLARLASGSPDAPEDEIRAALRSQLTLVRGGKADPNAP